MSNKAKVFKAITSGLSQIPDIAKYTGLYEDQVMDAISGLKYADGKNLEVKTKKIKVVELKK